MTTFSQVQFFTVDINHSGQRIDNFLITHLKGVPKSWLYRLIRKGQIRVNKKRVVPTYRLQIGDSIRVAPLRRVEQALPPAPRQDLCEFLLQQIITENEDWLVINKPAGLAVHTGSGVALGVIEILRAARPDAAFLELVHRLDKETSGCLLLAKSRSALQELQDLLRYRRIHKIYRALTTGHWFKDESKIVEAPLRRIKLPDGHSQVVVSPEGKTAYTEFSIIHEFPAATLVEVNLGTGRMHQIRVHAQYKGHPIAGDEKYGDKNFNKLLKRMGLHRLFLHAATLEFEWQGQRQVVTAKLPVELENILKKLDVS